MPTDLPISLSMDATTSLDKGYYHGVVFNIPGAEVNINGQWIAFSQANESLVKAQNPFTLKWRFNGDLLCRYGYKAGDTLTGTILAVDDQWNGLSLSKDITVKVE